MSVINVSPACAKPLRRRQGTQACLHTGVPIFSLSLIQVFRHAGVAISMLSMNYKIASVASCLPCLPAGSRQALPRNDIATQSACGRGWGWNMKPLSPPSQPSPLKEEGGSGSYTLSHKELRLKARGFPPSPKGTLKYYFPPRTSLTEGKWGAVQVGQVPISPAAL